jgi:MOSC domain-containing protein YiiM
VVVSARIVSVNVGTVRDLVIEGQPEHSAIDKRPAAGRPQAGRLRLAGAELGAVDEHAGRAQRTQG